MLAYCHGQILNVAQATVRRYLDLLEHLFLVRQLRQWHENLRKRQVKRASLSATIVARPLIARATAARQEVLRTSTQAGARTELVGGGSSAGVFVATRPGRPAGRLPVVRYVRWPRFGPLAIPLHRRDRVVPLQSGRCT